MILLRFSNDLPQSVSNCLAKIHFEVFFGLVFRYFRDSLRSDFQAIEAIYHILDFQNRDILEGYLRID